jgi:hypothetical protein
VQRVGVERCATVVFCWFLLAFPGRGVGAQVQQEATGGAELHRVHGVVLNAITHQPIARALVTSADQTMAVLTDHDGKFEFDVRIHRSDPLALGGPRGFARLDLRSSAVLMARKPGYRPMERPVVLLLSDDMAIKDKEIEDVLELKLIPEAIVMGRILAPGVEAPAGVMVQLIQRQVRDGLGGWMATQSVVSNARGEYRFADLAEGDFKIQTGEWMDERPFGVPKDDLTGFPPVSYPDAAGRSSAELLHIGAGQTIQADLNLKAKPYYAVEIPVANFVQGTGVGVKVEAVGSGLTFALGFNQRTQQIEGALPTGVYHVSLSGFGNEPSFATFELAVGGKAVRTPAVALARGATIPVEVREEYSTPLEARPRDFIATIGGQPDHVGEVRRSRTVEVFLRPENPTDPGFGLGNAPRNRKSEGNEGLVIENVRPGRYRVAVMPQRGYAAVVTSNGVDLRHEPLVVGAGGASAIEITLRDDTGSVTGTVTPASVHQSDPYEPSIMIWGFPVGEEASGRFVQGFVTNKGEFTLLNVPPGRYVVLAASPSLNQNLEYRDKDAMRRLEAMGVEVTVGAGQKVNATVPMMAAEGK